MSMALACAESKASTTASQPAKSAAAESASSLALTASTTTPGSMRAMLAARASTLGRPTWSRK